MRSSANTTAVNIKLDKAGGLTEALDMVREARRRDFASWSAACSATSLAMAPAMLLAQEADIVDLDGPLLLAKDRDAGPRLFGRSGLAAGARRSGAEARAAGRSRDRATGSATAAAARKATVGEKRKSGPAATIAAAIIEPWQN